MVAVFPSIKPTNIDVAPYSPRARANAKTLPAIIPFLQAGILILQKIKVLVKPSVFAENSRFSSNASNDALIVLYINGKETIIDAIIAPLQVIKNGRPILYKNDPNGVLFPNINIRIYPVTVGGRIRGIVKITSKIPLTTLGLFEM